MYMHAPECTHTEIALCGAVEPWNGENGLEIVPQKLTHSMMAFLHIFRMSTQRETPLQGTPAKMVSRIQERALLGSLATTRWSPHPGAHAYNGSDASGTAPITGGFVLQLEAEGQKDGEDALEKRLAIAEEVAVGGFASKMSVSHLLHTR
jgi:hypothetical protein